MKAGKHLYILWTNGDPITSEKMVFMYGINSLLHKWWDRVTIIIWGTPAMLVSQNTDIQVQIKKALDAGVHLTACKACADQLGATEILKQLGIEVKYWGEPLTELLKQKAALLTI